MAKPLDPDKRAAILNDIRAGHKGARAISRDHGVSVSTVSKIAREEGCSEAFERSRTENATIARRTDAAALRAQLSERFLHESNALLDELHRDHTAFNFGGKDNTYAEHTLDAPPPAEKRNLIIAAATALDKHLAVERHDGKGDGDAVRNRSLLIDLGAALGAAAEQLATEHDTPTET